MKNRDSAHPGRIKLTPVDAANGIYDLTRADEPRDEGTPLNKKLLDFAVAACGVTAGTATAYTLDDEFGGFELVDGAKVNFRLHVASGVNPTLNVNGTGAKALKTVLGDAMPSAIPAGMWVDAKYSTVADAYILSGGSVSSAQVEAWNEKPTTAQTQTIAENAAETQTKIISRTQLTAAKTEVVISIPSGYRRIRLTATLKPAQGNQYTDMQLTSTGTVKRLILLENEIEEEQITGISVGRGITDRFTHAVVEMIKSDNGKWQGSGYAVGYGSSGALIAYLYALYDFSGTSFNVYKSDYGIAAGSLFILEGLK